MNREFKVGLAVFIALVALGGIVFITGGALLRHGGNTYEILFPDAMGLEEGAPAYVSGIESGAVRNLRLAPDGVIVTVILDPSVRIPIDSRVLIDCFASTYPEAKQLAMDIASAMQTASFKVVPRSTQDLYEDAMKIYRVSQDFSIWY